MIPTGANAFQGPRASYVALACIASISFALLCSLWTDLATGYVSLLGLFGVYMASTELLILYVWLCPASMVVDIVRLAHTRGVKARGWLIFFATVYLACKVGVGGVGEAGVHRGRPSGTARAARRGRASSGREVPGVVVCVACGRWLHRYLYVVQLPQ